MITKSKDNRGGPGRGQGNKAGSVRVEERREGHSVSLLPSVVAAFKEKYGRGWARRIEELIKADLSS